jgi:hypothetical protein
MAHTQIRWIENSQRKASFVQSGPTAVDDREDRNDLPIVIRLVDDDVGLNEFACPFPSSRSANVDQLRQQDTVHPLAQCAHDPGGGIHAILGDQQGLSPEP